MELESTGIKNLVVQEMKFRTHRVQGDFLQHDSVIANSAQQERLGSSDCLHCLNG